MAFITNKIESTEITSSLFGTASYADVAQTLLGTVESASYAQTASYLTGTVESASYALTASYLLGGVDITGSVGGLNDVLTNSISSSKSILLGRHRDGVPRFGEPTSSIIIAEQFQLTSFFEHSFVLGDYASILGNSNNPVKYAVAIGSGSNAASTHSIAIGRNVTAFERDQIVLGRRNTSDPDKFLIIGDGTAEAVSGHNLMAFSQSLVVISGALDIEGLGDISASIAAISIGEGYIVTGETGSTQTIKTDLNLSGSIDLSGSINSSFPITASAFKGDGTEISNIQTASLALTASYVENALTASYITSSNVVGIIESASFALTASYVENALTASFITSSNIVGIIPTASYALTASMVLGSIESASFAATASIAQTASYALTASYISPSSLTGSFIYTGEITGSEQLINTKLKLKNVLNLQAGTSNDNVLIGNQVGDGLDLINSNIGNRPYLNVAIGSVIFNSNREDLVNDNIAIGYSIFRNPDTGSRIYDNIAIGNRAYENHVGSGGVAIGHEALRYYSQSNGNVPITSNIAVGYSAGRNLLDGSNNILIGKRAGYFYTDNTDATRIVRSIVIGDNAKLGGGLIGSTNEIIIGWEAEGKGINTTVLGNSDTAYTYLMGAVTASSFTGSFYGTASWADNSVTASNAISSSYSFTSSLSLNSELLGGLDSSSFLSTGSTGRLQKLSGSLTITQNLTVLGNATYTSITASEVILNQNLLTVFASGNAVPIAGYKAADTSSTFDSGALLYNVEDGEWTVTGDLTTAPAYTLTATTASFTSASISNLVVNNVDVTEQMSLTKRFNVTSSVSWSLQHDFNTITPMVQIYSASKVIIPLEIESVDANNTKITFSTTTEGTAVIIK